jgi:hypothetical protein
MRSNFGERKEATERERRSRKKSLKRSGPVDEFVSRHNGRHFTTIQVSEGKRRLENGTLSNSKTVSQPRSPLKRYFIITRFLLSSCADRIYEAAATPAL